MWRLLSGIHHMSAGNEWKWKWSNGVGQSEMDLFWCISRSFFKLNLKTSLGRNEQKNCALYTYDVVSRVEAGPSSTQQVPPSPPPTHSWRRPSSLPLLHSPQSLHKTCLTDRKPTCESFSLSLTLLDIASSGVAGPPPRLDPGQVSSPPPRSTQTRAQGPPPPALTQSLHKTSLAFQQPVTSYWQPVAKPICWWFVQTTN